MGTLCSPKPAAIRLRGIRCWPVFCHDERQATPEGFHALDSAAIRGDLGTVVSIFEAESLPNTPMERLI